MREDVKHLLEDIQKRPGVYIGKKSLKRLAIFMAGYMSCLCEREGATPFLPGFQEYIEMHYGLKDNVHVFRHWSDIISFFNATEEEAFDEFYKLLDKF